MRNLVWVLIPVLFVSAPAVSPVQGEDGAADEQFSEADEKLLAWCISQFPVSKWGESDKPLPRPAEKLRPFELAGALAPPDLVTQTEIVGTLPPEIEKYKGQWTWPAHDEAPGAKLFVERLTATEMTIAWAFDRKGDEDAADYPLRALMKWTGNGFSPAQTNPVGAQTLDIFISPNRAVMLVWSDYSRVISLMDKDGKETSHIAREAMPSCLVSDKYY